MKTNLILSAITVALLSGCGGGGGSDSSAPAIPMDPIEEPQPIDPTPITSSQCDYVFEQGLEEDNEFITNEYCNTPGLALIKASSAYLAGATGAGVKIAVMDTGINKEHEEFSGKTLDGVSWMAKYASDTLNLDGIDRVYSAGYTITFDQIEALEVTNYGSGYDIAPSIAIVGDGSGAVARTLSPGTYYGAERNDGKIYQAALIEGEYGSGYSYASATVDNTDTNGSGFEIGRVLLGGSDVNGHGSFIAGVIGANKEQHNRDESSESIQGIAYEADVYTIKAGGGGGIYFNESTFNSVLEGGAEIASLSFGSYPSSSDGYLSQELSDAVRGGLCVVAGAGNDGADNLPDANGNIAGRLLFPASLPYAYPELIDENSTGAWIVVGAVDENKERATFSNGYSSSNLAGVNKNYFLVAQGVNLRSIPATGESGYVSGEGTSYATPFVSGAMALMKSKYPHFTMRQIADIYFETAEDLGEPGIDDVYGRGLINIKAAFERAEEIDSAL